MKVLFLHRSFPGQFVHFARDLAARGHQVVALAHTHLEAVEGVRQHRYMPPTVQHSSLPHTRYYEEAIAFGLAVVGACRALDREGFRPDIVIGHTGWGETTFLKDVWPDAPVLGYFEFFHRALGADVGFDPEFPEPSDIAFRLRARVASELVNLDAADWGFIASRWQRSLYPPVYQGKLSVLHEGVDTAVVRPNRQARINLGNGQQLGFDDEVVTYCARDLEPYRGFHIFVRALPRLLATRHSAQVLIVGGFGASYGPMPPSGNSWKDELQAELGDRVDWSRVHFLGKLPYAQHLRVLQISSVHCYLSYPFIASWSLFEALATGCVVVGSKTPPVEEVINAGHNGYLVDFFDIQTLADTVADLLARPHEELDYVRTHARETIVNKYELHRHSLPKFRDLIGMVACKNTHGTGKFPDQTCRSS
ncbi:glycosyltransferase [Oryzibacter oryziterrae]|uniref:glycosyltransferase n=1 Tax=Oryzibacter oryziterrae TaxID=2766474 RepID=UPI001F19BBC8|nr:glycosyltransferase [Oryzibacter oryziterrae]